MKVTLTILLPTFIFALASTTSVEAKLRGLSPELLGSYLIEQNEADSVCETKDIDVCIAIDRSGTFTFVIPLETLLARNCIQ